MTVQSAIELVLADVRQTRAQTSQHTYRSMARKIAAAFGGDTHLADIDRKQVQAYVNARRLEVRAQTLRIEVSFLNSLYRAADEAGEDIPNPTARVKKPRVNNKRNRILLPTEQQALRDHLGPFDFSIVEFAVNTGLRRLEVWRVRPQDVQIFERVENGQKQLAGMLFVFTSKTGKPRSVPLNPIAASIAQEWLQRAKGEKWILPPYTTDKRFICANNWANRRFRPALAAAGIDGMTFHLLRHTFATRALQGGARLEQISWALGHASTLETESRYAHWGVDQVWPAVTAVMQQTAAPAPAPPPVPVPPVWPALSLADLPALPVAAPEPVAWTAPASICWALPKAGVR